MDECIPNDRANRDFSVKFPEEIRHDNLAGQLWFGAEVAYYLPASVSFPMILNLILQLGCFLVSVCSIVDVIFQFNNLITVIYGMNLPM